MAAFSSHDLTGLALIVLVFGLFIFSATLRIKNARKKLREPSQSKGKVLLEKADIIFSGIFLAWSFILLVIFFLNLGR
jgi:hypothetical protein